MHDSSPVLLHHQSPPPAPPPVPPRRSLKRTASTASFDTPPRLYNAKKRVRRDLRTFDSNEEPARLTEQYLRAVFMSNGSSTVQKTPRRIVKGIPLGVAPREEETEGVLTIPLDWTPSIACPPDFSLLSRTIQVPSRPTILSPSIGPVRRVETPKTPGQTKREEAKTPAEDSGKFPVFVGSPNNPFVTHSDPSPPGPRPREVISVLEEKPTV